MQPRGRPASSPDPVLSTGIDAPWRPIARTPAYRLVVDRIQEQITSGALGVGDRLPPERELAARLDVSRPAVREGLRMLEALGGLKMGVGTGPDSGTVVTNKLTEALAQLIRLHQGLFNFSLAEIAELGIALEAWSAQEASANASPIDHSRMRALSQEMKASHTSQKATNECDAALHMYLAEAGGNRIVAGLISAIRSVAQESILDAYESAGDWPSILASLSAEHDEILAAIAAGDSALAADRADKHARAFFGWLKSS